MSRILTPWTQQPQVPVGIDWSNPITRGLVAVVNPATRNSTLRGGAGSAYAIGKHGGYFKSNASAYLTTSTPLFGSVATILHFGPLGTYNDTNALVSGIGTSGAGNQCFIFQNGNSAAIRALIRVSNGGGITTAESSLGNVSNFSDDVWISVYDGTAALKLYRNGYNDTAGNANTAASGAMSSMDNFSLGGVDRGTDGYANTGAYAYLGCAWNRALSDAEIRSISANPWQIFQPIPRRIFVNPTTGGLSSVYSDDAEAYLIRNAISSDLAAAFNLRGAVSADVGSSYDLRSNAFRDATAAYSIRSLIQSDAAASYNLRGVVTANDAETYNVRGAVSADASAAYDVLSSSSVASTNTASYSVRGAVSSDVAASYTLRSAVAGDGSAAYSVRSTVSRDGSSAYNVAASTSSVSADCVASYSILNAGNGTGLTPTDINAIVAAIAAEIIPVDMVKTNGTQIIGDGTANNKFRSVHVG